MYSSTRRRIKLAAKLKADSANWVGYDATLVEEVSEELYNASIEADGEKLETRRSTLTGFAITLAIAIAALGFITLIWWSDWTERLSVKYRAEITEELQAEYMPVSSDTLYVKDGLIYIKQ
jgi:hypothetical protein